MMDAFDHAIVAERAMTRALAITHPCRYCGAMAGEECFNQITGEPLERMAAHLYRLQDSGAQ